MALADDVKSYCRTDEDLTAYVGAAKDYLTNAGVEVQEANALYCLAVKMLVANWYDNRGISEGKSRLVHGIDGIILQLKNQVTA